MLLSSLPRSPTSSSTRSFSVTMPTMPPYSSSTTARGLPVRFMLRNRASALMVSGTKYGVRTAPAITLSRLLSARRKYSLAFRMPTTLSALSSHTG